MKWVGNSTVAQLEFFLYANSALSMVVTRSVSEKRKKKVLNILQRELCVLSVLTDAIFPILDTNMDRQDLLFNRSLGMSLAKSILLLFPMEKRKAEVGGRYEKLPLIYYLETPKKSRHSGQHNVLPNWPQTDKTEKDL